MIVYVILMQRSHTVKHHCKYQSTYQCLMELVFPTEAAAQAAEDKQQGGLSHPLPVSAASTTTPTSSSSAAAQPESTEDNNSTDAGAASTSGRKWQFGRQLSRNKETSCSSRPVQDLLHHLVFVSIEGNQFRRNGMGDFGTFFY